MTAATAWAEEEEEEEAGAQAWGAGAVVGVTGIRIDQREPDCRVKWMNMNLCVLAFCVHCGALLLVVVVVVLLLLLFLLLLLLSSLSLSS